MASAHTFWAYAAIPGLEAVPVIGVQDQGTSGRHQIPNPDLPHSTIQMTCMLMLSMLRLLLSKVQEDKDLAKSSKHCHVGTHSGKVSLNTLRI